RIPKDTVGDDVAAASDVEHSHSSQESGGPTLKRRRSERIAAKLNNSPKVVVNHEKSMQKTLKDEIGDSEQPSIDSDESCKKETKEEEETTETSLLDLPDEIIEKIIAHLNFTDRGAVRATKRLRRIEERMEERGQGPKKVWKEVTITCDSTSSDFAMIVNGKSKCPLTLSTVNAIIRRLSGHILHLIVAVDPKNLSYCSLLNTVCEARNKVVDLVLSTNSKLRASPLNALSSMLNLSFFSQLIENSTQITVDFACPSLTVDDLIELKKVVNDIIGPFATLKLELSFDRAKEFGDRFMGVSPSFFYQMHSPFIPTRTNRNNKNMLVVNSGMWEMWMSEDKVVVEMQRGSLHYDGRYVLLFRASNDELSDDEWDEGLFGTPR
ncbi:hypothetical protein PFISCL1PPCAC_18835, partial [Pristionchus fissidentatus]